jgi:GNAT superfamily N-acetyltransferase
MLCQSKIELRPEALEAVVAQQLIGALNAELDHRYPEDGANHFDLAADEVSAGRGAFLVAYLDGQPVGCGAVRRIAPSIAEFKRMYVAPQARNRGIGSQLVIELERIARELGATRLVLETGVRQPEALALYTRAGFTRIPLFGEYINTPHPELTVCMEKHL